MKLGTFGRKVNLGVIGLGHRGYEQMKLLASMEDVVIKAISDNYPDRVQRALDHLKQVGRPAPFASESADDVLNRKDIEAVVIMTSWETHFPLAIKAIKNGIKPALEVGGSSSVQECWDLVNASETYQVPVMMLENCCYGEEELTLLNMVRQGVFGELVHVRGAYEHDLREEVGKGDIIRHYRQHHFLTRNAELYPTHELGPIARYLDINYGNRMLYLTSMSSKAAGLSAWMKEHRQDKPELANHQVNQGDVVVTQIKCANGETIVLTHDCTLPRPYSRGGRIQGTKGIWMEDNRSIYIDGRSPVNPDHWTHEWEKDTAYMEEYRSDLWKDYLDFGTRGGHGGMDYLVFRAFIEAIQQGTAFPIDVYDTVTWRVITTLSEQSIAMGSLPVAIPDFTNGKWLTRRDEAVGEYKLGR